jgi:PAS domain S-box-containing protein
VNRFDAALGQDPRNAAALLAGVLDSAMDAILTVDAQQHVVLYNRAAERIFGWPREEVLGQSLEKLIPGRFRGVHAQHVERFGATGVTSRRMGAMNVVKGLRKGGEEFPVDASISQLDTAQGKLYTVILRDVTERVRAQEELGAFAAAAHAIRESEKTRVARELHDELAQSLTALKMDTIWVRDNLQAAPSRAGERLDVMLSMLDGAVASTRRIAADLRPLLLDDLGLAPAIDWLAGSFTQRHGVPVDLELDEDLELPEPYATAVFRIVQESLQNVAKHARAEHAWVTLASDGRTVSLEVKDDGIGFDVNAPRAATSLGLMGLRERAQLLKGEVELESAPGEGTAVRVQIPLGQLESPVASGGAQGGS